VSERQRANHEQGVSEAERIGPHRDTEQYGLCIVSHAQTARPSGSTAPQARTHVTYPRMLLFAAKRRLLIGEPEASQ
jgi:hypothetical protein